MKNRLLVTISALLLSACAGQPMHYYSLQDGSPQNHVIDTSADTVQRVGIGPITLPKLLNRPQIVTRLSQSEVVFAEQHQWGGRLQEEVTQYLTTQLQNDHPQQWVYPYPSDARPLPTYQWALDIQQLDGSLGGTVQLQATCRFIEKSSQKTRFERQVTETEKTTDNSMSAYIDAQRKLLSKLAQACRW